MLGGLNLGFYPLECHRLIGLGVSIMNPRRSSDRIRIIMGIPLPRRIVAQNPITALVPNVHITWWHHQMNTFSASLAFCMGNSPGPVNSPHKGQWRGALMFSLIWTWINSWVNNPEAGDLRRHRAHCDVIVMNMWSFSHHVFKWYHVVRVHAVGRLASCRTV